MVLRASSAIIGLWLFGATSTLLVSCSNNSAVNDRLATTIFSSRELVEKLPSDYKIKRDGFSRKINSTTLYERLQGCTYSLQNKKTLSDDRFLRYLLVNNKGEYKVTYNKEIIHGNKVCSDINIINLIIYEIERPILIKENFRFVSPLGRE